MENKKRTQKWERKLQKQKLTVTQSRIKSTIDKTKMAGSAGPEGKLNKCMNTCLRGKKLQANIVLSP